MSLIDWDALAKTADDATKPIPDGDYLIKVTKAEAVTSSTGSPMIKMRCDVQDEGNAAGRKLFTQLVLSVDNGFALRRWFAALEAFGLDASWLKATDATLDMVAMALVGRYAMAEVGHGEWKGQARNQIDGWKVATDAMQPELPSAADLELATISGGSTPAGADDIQF